MVALSRGIEQADLAEVVRGIHWSLDHWLHSCTTIDGAKDGRLDFVPAVRALYFLRGSAALEKVAGGWMGPSLQAVNALSDRFVDVGAALSFLQYMPWVVGPSAGARSELYDRNLEDGNPDPRGMVWELIHTRWAPVVMHSLCQALEHGRTDVSPPAAYSSTRLSDMHTLLAVGWRRIRAPDRRQRRQTVQVGLGERLLVASVQEASSPPNQGRDEVQPDGRQRREQCSSAHQGKRVVEMEFPGESAGGPLCAHRCGPAFGCGGCNVTGEHYGWVDLPDGVGGADGASCWYASPVTPFLPHTYDSILSGRGPSTPRARALRSLPRPNTFVSAVSNAMFIPFFQDRVSTIPAKYRSPRPHLPHTSPVAPVDLDLPMDDEVPRHNNFEVPDDDQVARHVDSQPPEDDQVAPPSSTRLSVPPLPTPRPLSPPPASSPLSSPPPTDSRHVLQKGSALGLRFEPQEDGDSASAGGSAPATPTPRGKHLPPASIQLPLPLPSSAPEQDEDDEGGVIAAEEVPSKKRKRTEVALKPVKRRTRRNHPESEDEQPPEEEQHVSDDDEGDEDEDGNALAGPSSAGPSTAPPPARKRPARQRVAPTARDADATVTQAESRQSPLKGGKKANKKPALPNTRAKKAKR